MHMKTFQNALLCGLFVQALDAALKSREIYQKARIIKYTSSYKGDKICRFKLIIYAIHFNALAAQYLCSFLFHWFDKANLKCF